MKKILSLVLVLMMALSVAAMAEDMPVVKIGVFEPASGNNGAGGKQETLGMQYANAETPTVTIGDTEYKVELVIEDNQSSEEKAQSAAQSLVSAGVSVALGSYGSTVAMAGSATFEAAGVPVIGVTGYSGGKLKELADYRMHVNIDDMQIAEDIHMMFDHMLLRVIEKTK